MMNADNSVSPLQVETSAVLARDPRTVAFAFDVDGVLLRSKQPLPGAAETIATLQRRGIPFIFLTNGGGLTEADHAARLGSRLSLEIDEAQFVQSHSPFRDLVPLYHDKLVVALGGHGQQIRQLAHAYGFRHVLTSADIAACEADMHPFPEMTEAHHSEHGRPGAVRLAKKETDGRVKAILVFSSPRDWCLDLQVISDLLLSRGGEIGTRSPLNGRADLPNAGYLQDGQPELYFCNPDVEWATAYAAPRLAQGSFRMALEGVWAGVTRGQSILKYTICGKPTGTTYRWGEKALRAYHDKTSTGPQTGEGDSSTIQPAPRISTVYMIGDNPASDIRGASSFVSEEGLDWKSVLVETGVYQPGTVPDPAPTLMAKDVKEAVMLALQREGVQLGPAVLCRGQ